MQHSAWHHCSAADLEFGRRFEAGEVPPSAFAHRDHIRLAYVYLAEGAAEAAYQRMQSALQDFIRYNGIDPAKYHETLTRAWILAVDHFMHQSTPAASAAEFIAMNPRLLRKEAMGTHYSDALLFSRQARSRFVEPDLMPIPRHA